MLRTLLALLVALMLTACSVLPGQRGAGREIAYFDSLQAAPAFDFIELVECDGFVGLFREPTYEKAVRQAQARARRRGADAVIFYEAIKVSETAGADITKLTAQLALGRQRGSAYARRAEANSWDEQVFWYFIVAKVPSR